MLYYRKKEISSIYKAKCLLEANPSGKYYKKLFCLSLLDKKTYKKVSELCSVSILSLRNWLKNCLLLEKIALNPR